METKQIGIQMESFVDEITNSSTVIYTWANGDAVNQMKGFLRDMLDEAGVDKDVDELYDVQIQLKDADLYSIVEQEIENQINEMENRPKRNTPEYKTKCEEIENEVKERIKNGDTFDDHENWMGFPPSTTIIVKCKSSKKIMDFTNLFYSDGAYNG